MARWGRRGPVTPGTVPDHMVGGFSMPTCRAPRPGVGGASPLLKLPGRFDRAQKINFIPNSTWRPVTVPRDIVCAPKVAVGAPW